MTPQELLDRMREVEVCLPPLIEAAEFNSAYHTKAKLQEAYRGILDAVASYAWHVEGE